MSASDNMLVIVDFDGTATDIDQETIPFRQEFLRRMAELLNIEQAAFERMVCEQEQRIRRHPEQFGFVRCNRIVAPSNTDPYILPYEAIRCIMHTLKRWPDDDTIQMILYSTFESVLDMVSHSIVFREGIEEFFFTMQTQSSYIVSGSTQSLMIDKIGTLGSRFHWLYSRAFGDAKKYNIVDQLKGVPETFTMPGYYRPMYTRRHQYYWILDHLRRRHSAQWSDVLVIGDIFEADGALPFSLGARFALMLREGSLQHEIDFLRSHERGMVINSLDEARELLIR